MNTTLEQNTCPCGSANNYTDCCEPFLSGKQLPTTPETLMRSRYTAYCKMDIDYIANTMKDAATQGFDRESAKLWAEHITMLGLQIVNASEVTENSNQGIVEFIVRFRMQDKIQNLHEISEFQREGDRWYYVDGKPGGQQVQKTIKIGRNDSCFCGSGKKYKKCCGN